MNAYDSKLFYGIELGKLEDVLGMFNDCYMEYPPHKPHDMIDEVGWINTQLPEGVYLEVTYPKRSCEDNEMIAHLTLLDNDDNITAKEMRKFLKNVNVSQYGYVLGMLGLQYQEPTFYTKYYIYD